MINPLENVPLNTSKVYVMSKTRKGCEIYMPVDSNLNPVINKKKEELENFLKSDENSPAPKFDFNPGPRLA